MGSWLSRRGDGGKSGIVGGVSALAAALVGLSAVVLPGCSSAEQPLPAAAQASRSTADSGNQDESPSGAAAPANPNAERAGSSSASPDAEIARALTGTWEGRYRCAQGPTGLTLIIYLPDGGDDEVLATFKFYPLPTNPRVPAGSFALKGTFSPSALTLSGDHWIERPAGYNMVDLAAPMTSASPTTISGEVKNSPRCAGWEVEKVSGETRKPPA
jgi:hypothetical protein